MGGIAGVFYTTDRSVGPEDYAHLIRRFRGTRRPRLLEFGADGPLMAQFFDDREFGTGFHGRTSKPSAVTWDGRLDNRQSLVSEFAEPGDPEVEDSGIVSQVFQSDGVAGLVRLIGDWSAAIWDPDARQVVLASDHAGTRPLYYRYAGGSLVWSSSLDHIVAWTGAEALDEDFAAEFLTTGAAGPRTPYRGVFAVPAGTAVLVSARTIQTRTFWQLAERRTVHFRDEQEYAERLYILVEDAVRARLRDPAPVYCELSGGLDSSAIVCMAHKLITERRVAATGLVTVSYHHPGSQDERFYTAVERACSVRFMHLETSDFPFVAEHSAGGAAPVWWAARHCEMAARLRSCGASTFLTGQLGDLVMGNWRDDSEQVADLIYRGQWKQAFREAATWGESLQVPVYSILLRALRMNLPWANYGLMDRNGPYAPPRSSENSLTPALRRRARELACLWAQHEACGSATPGKHKLLLSLSEAFYHRTLHVPEQLQPAFYSHPYSHRPLVEFMLSIPAAVVCRPDEPRRLMRRAFRDLLPPAVLRRRSKAEFHSVFFDALKPLAASLLRAPGRSLLVSRGYIQMQSLEHRLNRFLRGLDCNESQLRHLLLLEFWLREYELRQSERSASPLRTLQPA